MKPVIAVLITSVGLALSGCAADSAAGRPAAGSGPSQEPPARSGAHAEGHSFTSIKGVSPFLPEPKPFAWPAPPHPLAPRIPAGGNAMDQTGGATLCRNWTLLLTPVDGQEDSHNAAREVLDAHFRVAPGELELASRIMIQRLATMRGNETPELVGTMFLLSYERLADACRAVGAPLLPNTS